MTKVPKKAKRKTRTPSPVETVKNDRSTEDRTRGTLHAARLKTSHRYIDDGSAHFSREKIEQLRKIVQGFNIPNENFGKLIERTQNALLEFQNSDKTNRAETLEKLDRLLASALEFQSAYANLGRDLRLTIFERMSGLRQSQPTELSPAQMVDRFESAERIKTVMRNDLRLFVGESTWMARDFRADATKTRLPAEYLLVERIAHAWFDSIGEKPAITNNQEATEHPQFTPFQAFLRESAPGLDLNGSFVLKIIQALKFGSG